MFCFFPHLSFLIVLNDGFPFYTESAVTKYKRIHWFKHLSLYKIYVSCTCKWFSKKTVNCTCCTLNRDNLIVSTNHQSSECKYKMHLIEKSYKFFAVAPSWNVKKNDHSYSTFV